MHNFLGQKEWKHSLDIDLRRFLENKDVTVLRSILFFHSEQKTDLNTIQKYFTDEAIYRLSHDKFIKIHD